MRRKPLPPRRRAISQKENRAANLRLKAEAKKARRAAGRAAEKEPVVEEAPEEPVVEEAPEEPVVEEAPEEPVVEEAPEEPVVGLSVLENSIGDLTKALETGAYDANLVALTSAEKEDKNRKGALRVLRERLASLG